MKVYLLAQNNFLLAGIVILSFAVLIILIEALVMLLFKMNSFRKTFLDSLMANIGSFLLAVLLFLIFNKNEFEIVTAFVIFYIINCFFEAWIVKLLNTGFSWGRTITASFVMNLLTFAAVYFIVPLIWDYISDTV